MSMSSTDNYTRWSWDTESLQEVWHEIVYQFDIE
jgi:hypothetical protein